MANGAGFIAGLSQTGGSLMLQMTFRASGLEGLFLLVHWAAMAGAASLIRHRFAETGIHHVARVALVSDKRVGHGDGSAAIGFLPIRYGLGSQPNQPRGGQRVRKILTPASEGKAILEIVPVNPLRQFFSRAG